MPRPTRHRGRLPAPATVLATSRRGYTPEPNLANGITRAAVWPVSPGIVFPLLSTGGRNGGAKHGIRGLRPTAGFLLSVVCCGLIPSRAAIAWSRRRRSLRSSAKRVARSTVSSPCTYTSPLPQGAEISTGLRLLFGFRNNAHRTGVSRL